MSVRGTIDELGTGPGRDDPVPPAVTRRTFRCGPVAGSVRVRALVVPTVGAVALVVVMLGALVIGGSGPGAGEVLAVLAGDGSRTATGIVLQLRLPRVLVAALVGAALGLAGAVFQSLARNPLASPDILGITGGSAAAAVAVITVGGARGVATGAVSAVGVPLAGLAGGLAAGVTLYALAWRRGLDTYRLVLIGLALSALGLNTVHWLLTIGEVDQAARATTWLVGNLASVGWDAVAPSALALAVLVPAVLVCSRRIGVLGFSDETARGLGLRVDATRAGLLLLAAALAAVAAAAAGPIAFVALATPQLAMRSARSAAPPLMGSLVLGALLTAAADLVVRVLPLPGELPVGVLTAVLGAPYLIALFLRTRRRSTA